ncbi:molybdenum cofactor biosynthesis protein MoaE [Klebsiella pneumoniae]|uniref:Molybdopterin synthase catalytic subunit n=1 Tax=Klebsiella pneumoniae TaxID=573 RepID=A0A939NMF3_KLEPN|nr:molybdenum cofactor biosynthesis protein MoaE [Klebsiella pneumoniae]
MVTFTGKVRNHNLGDSVKALTLEHYPGMTENRWRKLSSWRASAGRWAGDGYPSHRRNVAGEEIVFVGVTSAHRGSASPPASLLWIT